MSREHTSKLLEMVADGLLDKDTVILACVKYMSESDVADMMDCNEWSERFNEDEDETEYTYEDEEEVRAAFWDFADSMNGDGITRRKFSDGSYSTDTRCAFVDYVDSLARDGQISEALAQRVTL
jgi:hypothetical protein